MGLCLVTRLKESVADSSLLKLGEKAFLLNADGEFTIRGMGTRIRVIDDSGSLKVTQLGSSTSTDETDFALLNGNYHVCKNLSGKDLKIGISEILNMNVFSTDKYIKCMEVDLNMFTEVSTMTEIKLNNQLIVGGSLASLKNITSGGTSLTALSFSDAKGVTGSIEDIGGLHFSNNVIFNFYRCANVNGDIVNFVKKQRQIGRTSATCNDANFVYGSGITFNGNPVGSVSGKLSWTPTTITVADTTINA